VRPTRRPSASDDEGTVGDAYGELVGWDGKLARTIRLLLVQPGGLTRAVIESQPRMFRPMFRAMAADDRGLMRRATDAMPRVLFILIPVLAAVLRLFYRRRHYPEHLYFAVHFGAFVFIVLTVEVLAVYTRSLVLTAAAQLIGALVIVVYGVVAQRRVYGGSWLATRAKAFGVSVVYGALWSVLAVTLWASR
jgi:hypothetical protein